MAHQVSLTWVPPVGGDPVAAYDVLRAPVVGGVIGTFVSIANPEPTAASYIDLAVVAGAVYEYEVKSVNASGESVPCAGIQVTIPLAIPNPPTGLVGSPQ